MAVSINDKCFLGVGQSEERFVAAPTIGVKRQYLFKVTGVLLNSTRFRALLTKEGYAYRQPKHTLKGKRLRPK